MKNRFNVLIGMMFIVLVLVGCAQRTQDVQEGEKVTQVAAIFMGATTDQSWNQLGLEGVKQADEVCDINYSFSENVAQAEFDETFRNYAQQGFDIVIGHSGTFTESALRVAPEFPETQFVVINSLKGNGTNMSGIAGDYYQSGYMAGAIACQMTKTNKVALVTAEVFPMVEPSFETFPLGANSCGKEVDVQVIITGSFDDVTKAYEATIALAEEGVDVVYHQLDSADVGVFSAAEDKGIYVIGLYEDQSFRSPSTVIGSVFISPSTQTYEAACGRVTPGQAELVSLANGLQIVMTSLMPQEAQDAVWEIAEDLKAGKIDY